MTDSLKMTNEELVEAFGNAVLNAFVLADGIDAIMSGHAKRLRDAKAKAKGLEKAILHRMGVWSSSAD
jgi:hypothetical protein